MSQVTKSAEIRGAAALAGEEQERFAVLARSLTEVDWQSPSWCAGWTVGDVVVHTAAHLHGKQRDKRMLHDLRQRPRDELVDWLASPIAVPFLPSKQFRRVDEQVQLGELVVHMQDITGALGLTCAARDESITTVLTFGTRRIGSLALTSMRKRARGLQLVASDVDWTSGTGPEVRGPGIALIMATSGREPALEQLSGAGVDLLAQRVPAQKPVAVP
jgi:uncharacterized protein (TIGR03083 family)